MTTDGSLSIIIPAFNEENGIGPTLENVLSILPKIGPNSEIIVVDDGSTDQTSRQASKYNVQVIRHPKNLGYGRSLMTGIRSAKNEWVGIIDADGTYDSEEFLKMTPMMNTFDMVIGVRNLKILKESLALKSLRFFLRSIIIFFTGRSSPDANSGLRIFKKSLAIGNENLFSLMYSFSTSLTLFAHLTSRFVEYIPVSYSPRLGFSKVRHVRDSLRTLKLILGMALIYRSFRYFSAIMLAGIVAWAFLTLLIPFIGFALYLPLVIMTSTLLIIVSLGALCSIMGQVYFKQ